MKKNKVNLLLSLIFLVCLQGCDIHTEKDREVEELRKAISTECVELITKDVSATEEEIADVLEACNLISYYQTKAFGG